MPPAKCDLFSLGHSISYRQIHMPSSFSGWNRRTGTSVSPDEPVTMRRRSATTTATPLGVLLQTMPLISVSCEPCDDRPAARTITGGAVDELQHQADGQLWQVILCRRCRRFRGSRRSETLIPAAMASDRGTVQLLD